jgi:hypothetical protein
MTLISIVQDIIKYSIITISKVSLNKLEGITIHSTIALIRNQVIVRGCMRDQHSLLEIKIILIVVITVIAIINS